MARTPGRRGAQIKLADDPEEPIDGAEEPIVVEPVEGEGAETGVNGHDVIDESVEELKAQLAEERARRAEAEQRASRERNTVEDAQTQILNTQFQVIENALAKEDGIKKELRAKITAAKESGDYAAEVDALDELQQANTRINRLTEGKNELERRIETVKETPADPVERYVRTLQNPKDQDWIRAHPDFVTDDTKRSDLAAAHYRALGFRYQPGTPQYYDYVERELGLKDGADEREEPAPSRQLERRPPAAPPSRPGVPMASARNLNLPAGVQMVGDGQYRLSPEHREYARISGMSDLDYLKNLLALHSEGRLMH